MPVVNGYSLCRQIRKIPVLKIEVSSQESEIRMKYISWHLLQNAMAILDFL